MAVVPKDERTVLPSVASSVIVPPLGRAEEEGRNQSRMRRSSLGVPARVVYLGCLVAAKSFSEL